MLSEGLICQVVNLWIRSGIKTCWGEKIKAGCFIYCLHVGVSLLFSSVSLSQLHHDVPLPANSDTKNPWEKLWHPSGKHPKSLGSTGTPVKEGKFIPKHKTSNEEENASFCFPSCDLVFPVICISNIHGSVFISTSFTYAQVQFRF